MPVHNESVPAVAARPLRPESGRSWQRGPETRRLHRRGLAISLTSPPKPGPASELSAAPTQLWPFEVGLADAAAGAAVTAIAVMMPTKTVLILDTCLRSLLSLRCCPRYMFVVRDTWTVGFRASLASDPGSRTSWQLGGVTRIIAASEHEWFVLVLLPKFPRTPRAFVVPPDHVSAATWIMHMNWRTDPSAPEGKRNVGLSQARVQNDNHCYIIVSSMCSPGHCRFVVWGGLFMKLVMPVTEGLSSEREGEQ